MRRAVVAAGIAVVAAGAAVAAAVGFGGDDGSTAHAGDLPPTSAPVTRETLVATEEFDGQLGYGEPVALRGGGGMVTWLAAEGATVSRGKPIYRSDGAPVVLLYGPLPLWRPLAPGVAGPDVRQFEQNLAALGYDGFTVDDDYTGATADAVREWQDDLGVDETGTVTDVAYAAGPIRIASHATEVGAPAGGTVLSYTGTTRLVTIDLPVGDRDLAVAGAAATVELPDGKTARGKVATVGAVATAAEPDGDPTVQVTVTVADQKALGDLREAPVDLALTAESRADVLTVPVAALVALAEGGYGVQVLDGGAGRFLAVDTGLFAGGRVEVSGTGLTEGMTVGMPS
ncbi:peptidoglycan-binding domain-containing protein [Asanoa sp. WMMD1127]|uniref:peptidoglycan-binding domain-containing protein n=1 Tax=Asanoa sp. WMMD1127 TaxID=3016107 RepID=UPI002417FF34|nr:peptidoglycan-binding domain-containing protein [Asanoa sp. WMMD1127]MDG4822196.1 peptidoglycan-binding domain-containing protein [Asanoa sp. WMMD1127]